MSDLIAERRSILIELDGVSRAMDGNRVIFSCLEIDNTEFWIQINEGSCYILSMNETFTLSLIFDKLPKNIQKQLAHHLDLFSNDYKFLFR